MNKTKEQIPEKLPIYRLAPPQINDAQLEKLAREAFGMTNYALEKAPAGVRFASGTKSFEVNLKTGALWMADKSGLWNPEANPRLLKPEDAEQAAQKFIQQYALLPKSAGGLELKASRRATTGTRSSTFNVKNRQRRNKLLDRFVSYEMRVAVPNLPQGVPVIGELGKLGATYGHQGQVIGLNQAWRNADGVETQSRVIPRERADQEFRKLTANLKIESHEVSLAYKAFSTQSERTFLCPVWVHRATARFGDRLIPLRNIALPATEFGPPPPKSQPQQPRAKREQRAPWANGVPKNYRKRAQAIAQANSFEAGTSWIGLSGGLSGSQNNAGGFVNELQAEGWDTNFNWGDQNAWESDWRRNDDDWVDAADFVFYTGHADGNGWVLSNPDDGGLDYTEVGATPENPGDLYGQLDLEWLIVAACGPLEDNIISAGGGDVFDRWDGIFDGLHLLMGYGAVTFDNEEEGRRVVQYARAGDTLIDAWFRAAREIQPSDNGVGAPFGPTIYVSAMTVGRSGLASPWGDHLWGRGSVAADPTSPDSLFAMWSPT